MQRLKTIGCAALLFAANAYVCRELFVTTYIRQMGSVEGAFIAFSRYTLNHWPDLLWWPVWFLGMPYQNVYGPGLHFTVAGVAALCRIPPALAYHAVTAIGYCLGPVTLFWMCARFSGSRPLGFTAGLLYSVISPSAWIFRDVRADLGGAFLPRRLYSMIHYGDGPHVAALALLPLALLAVDRALRTKRPRDGVIAALSLAAVVLTNWPGTMGLSMALLAYLGARLSIGERPPWLVLAVVCLLGYTLVAPWAPPSTVAVVAGNARTTGEHFPLTWLHLLYPAGFLALLTVLHQLFRWLKPSWFLRFLVFFTLLPAVISLAWIWSGIGLLPQPLRFQLEMEMGLAALAACAVHFAARRAAPHWRVAVILLLSAFSVLQLRAFRQFERKAAAPLDIRGTTEYKMARWFDDHMRGDRVFAPGSVSLWMNVFTDTPQIGGCCDQGALNFEERVALHTIYTGQNAGDRDAQFSLQWLKAYGAQAVAVSGPRGGEYYKAFAHPWKFEGLLPVLWREGDDVIYRVPQRTGSLAHVVRRGQTAARAPVHGLDTAPLEPYLAALDDPSLPTAEMEWKNGHSARIRAPLAQDQLISVQVSWHPGWHARVNGSERRITSDAIGLMVIEPDCAGNCVIDLTYDGGLEMRLARTARLLGLLACVAGLLVPRRRAAQ